MPCFEADVSVALRIVAQFGASPEPAGVPSRSRHAACQMNTLHIEYNTNLRSIVHVFRPPVSDVRPPRAAPDARIMPLPEGTDPLRPLSRVRRGPTVHAGKSVSLRHYACSADPCPGRGLGVEARSAVSW